MQIEHLRTIIAKVTPVIYRTCGMQELLVCGNDCVSPMTLCRAPYYDKPDGCPNYGREDCPPNTPYFDEVYDMSEVILVGCQFDFKQYLAGMASEHPDWADRQLRNVIYWQSQAKKMLNEALREPLEHFRGFEVCYSPEAMGVRVDKTFKQSGFELEFPPVETVWKVALLAKPLR